MKKAFSYVERFKLMACISGVIILAGIVVGIFTGGLNMGVDFTGGTLVNIDTHTDFDMDVVENALAAHNIEGAQAMRTGSTTSSQTMVDIRMRSLNDDATESQLRQDVLETIRETYPQAEIKSVDRVDGVASGDLIRNAVLSVLIASVLMLAYIWIRFELLSGVAAVLALLHDVAIMLAFTCILRIPVNSPFIAAVLTIVGYSINNTIVVFDRVRENGKHEVNIEKNREAVVNKSIRQSLTRSINTSITTLLTITMVYLFGVESIKQFALPIIIGLLAGTYSSIFLAAPMWAKWHINRFNKEKAASRK